VAERETTGVETVNLLTPRPAKSNKAKWLAKRCSICGKGIYNILYRAASDGLHIGGLCSICSKADKQKTVPQSYMAVITVLPAVDIGKTHVAITALCLSNSLLKEYFI
jgi:hypothetical protein